MNLTHHLKQHRDEDRLVDEALRKPKSQFVLFAMDEEGGVVRMNSASLTQAGRESLQEQADRYPGRAWVSMEQCR